MHLKFANLRKAFKGAEFFDAKNTGQ